MRSRRNELRLVNSGFTLIELVVVLLVLSILAFIALPSYQESVRRAKRAEAWAVLMKTMQQQERYYSVHGSYAAFSAAKPQSFIWYSGSSPESSAYEISAAACEGYTLKQCVMLTAEPGTPRVQRSYSDPGCGSLSFNSAGKRSAGGNGRTCW